jgi:hypothetical protein
MATAAPVSLYERYCFIHFALVSERKQLQDALPLAEADSVHAAHERVALTRMIGDRSPSPEIRAELMAQYAPDFAEFDRRASEPARMSARLAELGPLIQQADQNKRRHAPPMANPFGVAP